LNVGSVGWRIKSVMMSRFRGCVLGVAGAAVIAGFGLAPASAGETAAVPGETVSADAAVVPDGATAATNPAPGQISAARPTTIGPQVASKSKVFQRSQQPEVHPASLAQRDWICFGPWCSPQIVLMLGIGY